MITDNSVKTLAFSEKAQQDFRLIDQAVSYGDERAYDQLMSRYKKSVYHMILKMVRNPEDAEDLTLESFGKAFKNLDRFKKDYTFTTWIFRIATNHTIDFIRKKRLNTLSLNNTLNPESDMSFSLDVRDTCLTPDQSIINDQKIALVQIYVKKLPIKYRQLVHLRYFDELSLHEISCKLDTPLGTIKAQLHRSRELMHQLMKIHLHHI
tara:strand:+ start:22656 stop:23279 length:624 start_codon:yes stop_codon:yes gene_type:complete